MIPFITQHHHALPCPVDTPSAGGTSALPLPLLLCLVGVPPHRGDIRTIRIAYSLLLKFLHFEIYIVMSVTIVEGQNSDVFFTRIVSQINHENKKKSYLYVHISHSDLSNLAILRRCSFYRHILLKYKDS